MWPSISLSVPVLIESVLLLGLFSGVFGAAPLTNTGAVIADVFKPQQEDLRLPFMLMFHSLLPSLDRFLVTS